MLKRFSVKNFKGFGEECVVDFSKTREYGFGQSLIKDGLVNKALLYGYNGSGKSNLGFAIMDIAFHLIDANERLPEGHYVNYLNADSTYDFATFKYTFQMEDDIHTEIVYEYQKDQNRKLVNERIQVNGKTVFSYNHLNGQYINDLPGSDTLVLSNKLPGVSAVKFVRNNSVETSSSPLHYIVRFAENMLWFRSVQGNEYIGQDKGTGLISDYIINNNKVEDFQKFLKDSGLSFNLVPRNDLSGKKHIMSKHKNKMIFFFDEISTGTASLVLFYYWFSKRLENVSFLFLDEFDAFYHTKLSKAILNMVNKNNSFQSILTTHNSFLADNSIMRPDCYWIIKDGKVRSFADRTKKVIREGNSLENMLLSDEFN